MLFVCDYLKERKDSLYELLFYRKQGTEAKTRRRRTRASWRSQKKQVNFRELFFFADQVHSM